jgi:AcrR family transcriptional regulator
VVNAHQRADWRQSRRDSARAAILAVAWAVVRENGLSGLSLRDLARRAGITTPTIYAYFASKNDIYDAMFGKAAEDFALHMAPPHRSDDPRDILTEGLERFVEFCLADLARYQLLFQHAVPGFEPSAESYAPAQRALDSTRAHLALNGVTDERHLDMWTAITTGLVSQQIANDAGGDRWTRLIDDVVAMFLDYCQPPRPSRRRKEHP